jgi:hypothetical protein
VTRARPAITSLLESVTGTKRIDPDLGKFM